MLSAGSYPARRRGASESAGPDRIASLPRGSRKTAWEGLKDGIPALSRLLTQATVDQTDTGWRVTVWGGHGPSELSQTRTYELAAKSDTLAAQEGMRRFAEEFGDYG